MVVLLYTFGSLLLPAWLDGGGPLRSAIFNTFGLRPPMSWTNDFASIKPVFTLTPAGRTDTVSVRNGMKCLTGDIINVSFKLDQRVYILMFGYDGRDTYRLEGMPKQTFSHDIGEVGDRVQLSQNAPDETLTEQVFVVWSKLPFDAQGDVFSKLYKLYSNAGSRGGVPTHALLDLPNGMGQDSFTCVHTNPAAPAPNL